MSPRGVIARKRRFATALAGAALLGILVASPAAQAAPVPTTTVLVGAGESGVGSPVELTAVIQCPAATPTGDVTFSQDGVVMATASLVDGAATATTPDLAVGEYVFTAEYGGDGACAASTSAPVVHRVVAGTVTLLQVVGSPPRVDLPITVEVAVASVVSGAGTPQGGVDFFVDDESQGLSVLEPDGTTTVGLSVPTAGIHTVTATYNAQGLFTGSSAVLSISVAAPPPSELPPPSTVTQPAEPAPEPGPAEPVTEVAASTAVAAAPPAELPFTGAFTLPGLLVGTASIGMGLGCRRFAARGGRRATA